MVTLKKTYRKNILRTIGGTMSRFLAIFAIVALGVGFLAGLLATTPDMRYSGDKYFDDTHLFDIRTLGTLALSRGDVAAIRAVEGVGEVMPAYSADLLVNTPGGDTLVTRIHSLPMAEIEEPEPQGWLNRFQVVEGRVPVKENECVIEAGSQYGGASVKIGDLLTVSEENKDPDATLARREFKVVGVVQSSYYFSIEREPASVGSGTIGLIMYVGEDSFALDAYTDVYLTVQGAAELGCLGAEYEDLVDAVADRIEEISDARSAIRYREVKAEAEEKLADARSEYEDAKAEADEKLADAEQQLADGRAEVERGEAKLKDAKAQISSGEKELAENRETLPGALTDKQQQLAAAQAALIDAKAQLEENEALLAEKQQQLADAKAQLETAKQLVSTLEPVLTQAEAQLPVLEAAIPPLQQTARQAQASYDAAVSSTDYRAKKEAYEQAEATLAASGGYASYEEWEAADPTAAQAAKAARDAAKAEFDAADAVVSPLKTSLDTANAQLAAAQRAYETAKQSAEAARKQIDDAKEQIAVGEPQLAEGEKQLAEGQRQLADARKQVTEVEKQIASGQTALSLAPGLAQLQLDLAQYKLDSAKSEVAGGEAELSDAREQLEKGEAEYRTQKADAERQLADAEQQLADAQKQIDELEEPEWYVLTRDTNVSYASFKANVEKVEAVAKVFPIFFFLVAALVVLTTMTRMVEEERLQIGTMKALGYSKGAIMMKYVWYALIASVAGSAAGLLIGLNLLPVVIWNAYTMMYRLPRLYCLFNVPFAVFSSGTAIFCALAATLYACWTTLHECPASLMLPRAPKAGKRILLERVGFVWKRMKFTHKVTARNLFRYKKRFFMTVIGISGCTALLVTGFGLHDSISDIVNRQFGEIFTYNLSITLKEEGDQKDDALQKLLNDGEKITSTMAAHQEKSANTYDGDTFNTYLYVPQDPERLPEFVDLHTRRGNHPVELQPDGVVITEKMSERTGKGVGDAIELENSDHRMGTFTITGVVENYVENYVYMTGELYEEQFGRHPDYTLVAAHTADASQQARDALSAELFDLDCVSGVSFTDDVKTSFSGMMQKIDTIVVVLIVCAGLLAFVVLYNLTNINITEREKEIATIKVLGFFDKEVSAYVYRESAVLSLIGTLAGLVLGVFLHMFVIYTVEVDAVMFGRSIKPLSYLFAALLTLLFSLLVNLVMHRKLKKISMVESMKAPE